MVPGDPPGPATGFTITAGNAEATLKWTPVQHATGYYGETAFTKLPWPVSGPEWTSEGVLNGGSYEFRIASANGSIAGPQSNAATARPVTAPPAGPATLTATPGNAEATLSWTAATDATGHWVHVRNVTTGEDGFTKLPYPVTGTEWSAGSPSRWRRSPPRAADKEVGQLAQGLLAIYALEEQQLLALLADWGRPTPDSAAGTANPDLRGTFSAETTAELAALSGPALDRRFVSLLIGNLRDVESRVD